MSALAALLLAALPAWSGGKAFDDLKAQGGAGAPAVSVAAVVPAGAAASPFPEWSGEPQKRQAQLRGVFEAVKAWYKTNQGFAKPVAMKYLPDEEWADPSANSPASSKPPGPTGAAAGGPGDVLVVRVGRSIFEATAGRPDPGCRAKACRGPDEAAFVLGHEIGHLLKGHWETLDAELTKADRTYWADGGPGQELERLVMLEQAGKATDKQKARIKELRRLGDNGARMDALQRPMEAEADELGVKAAAGVGADPAAGAAFMMNMVDIFGKLGIHFGESHDSPQGRAARIRQLAAGLQQP